MAGLTSEGLYVEKVSKFLRDKIDLFGTEYGKDSAEYKALTLQYLKNPKEEMGTIEKNKRHWEADVIVDIGDGKQSIHGMERLYNRSIVVEPTMICSSHCRYCLRGNYETFTLKEDELLAIAKYCGTTGAESGLSEILITGGDPAIVPHLLSYFVDCLVEFAPNINIIRIATRLLTHDPGRLGNVFFNILKKKNSNLRFEIATQINHASEFFPETIEAMKKIQDCGAYIYSQNVLLKGVNDNLPALIDLYTAMRKNNIIAHYLFHCVPLQGMQHFRTTVNKGLELTRALVNSGYISGRCKPMYALMTDIGKITLYEGTIKGYEDGRVVLSSNYKYSERMAWNPSWKLPETAFVENDYICVRYLDGFDD